MGVAGQQELPAAFELENSEASCRERPSVFQHCSINIEPGKCFRPSFA